MPDGIVLLIPIMALSIPIIAIVAAFKHKSEELRIKAGMMGDANVASQLREIQNQITELRDTTTRYDMSFDSALQRIESRVGNLENRVTAVERAQVDTQPVGQRTPT
jgi:hypothetical protein